MDREQAKKELELAGHSLITLRDGPSFHFVHWDGRNVTMVRLDREGRPSARIGGRFDGFFRSAIWGGFYKGAKTAAEATELKLAELIDNEFYGTDAGRHALSVILWGLRLTSGPLEPSVDYGTSLVEAAGLEELRKKIDPSFLPQWPAPPRLMLVSESRLDDLDATGFERKRQAMTSFPYLTERLLREPFLVEAIETESPLSSRLPIPAIWGGNPTKETGEWSAPRIRRVGAWRHEPWADLGHVLRLASHVPVPWIPQDSDEAEVRAFELTASLLSSLHACAPDGGSLAEGPIYDNAHLVSNAKGRWVSFLRRIAAASRSEKATDVLEKGFTGDGGEAARSITKLLGGAVRSCGDVGNRFAAEILLPLLAARRGWDDCKVSGIGGFGFVEAGMMALFHDRTLEQILDASFRWHDRRPRPDMPREQSSRPKPVFVWPVPFDTLKAPNGVEIVALGDGGSLHDDGCAGLDGNGVAGLHHCVSGYAVTCMMGRSTILSFRTESDGRPVRLSTMEVKVPKDAPAEWSVRQHFGKRNTPPATEADLAATWLLEAVRAGEVPLSDEWLDHMTKAREMSDYIAMAAGYDWRNPFYRAAYVEAWTPFLPKAARGVQEADLLDFPPFARAADLLERYVMAAGGPIVAEPAAEAA